MPHLYDSCGIESAPTILFLHGVASTRKAFLPQMRALRNEFHLLALDLPGHGIHANQPFSLQACVPLITKVLEQAGSRRVLLAGSSMGAYVALTYAAQQPERVAGLVVSGCGIDFSGGLAFFARGFASFMRGTQPITQPIMKVFDNWTLRNLDAPIASEIQAAGYFYAGWSDCYRELAAFDAYTQLRTYPGPLLILNGSYDFHRPMQKVLAAAAQMPTVQTIVGASHFPNLEQPERYNQALRGFAVTVFGRG